MAIYVTPYTFVSGTRALAAEMNANFAAVTNGFNITEQRLNERLPLAGGTMSGILNMDNNRITGLPSPQNNSDAVPLSYLSTIVTGSVPIGTCIPYLGATPPTADWLVLNGSTYNINEYPSLYSLINSNTLPDFRARVPKGVASGMTGTDGRTNKALRNTGGSENKTLTINNMPRHRHDMAGGSHTHAVNDGGHTHSIADAGHRHSVHNIGGSASGVTSRLATSTGNQVSTLYTSTTTSGISIYNATSNITIGAATFSGYTTYQGNDSAFDTQDPYIVVNWLVKAR